MNSSSDFDYEDPSFESSQDPRRSVREGLWNVWWNTRLSFVLCRS